MRPAFRLYAGVKSALFLEPGNPTGLTGLYNHPSPRSTLLYLYSTTLERLRGLPEHSVYRQSVEALTRHRRSLVESVKPDGFDEWVAKAKQTAQTQKSLESESLGSRVVERDGQAFTLQRQSFGQQPPRREWDGQAVVEPKEGPRSSEENINVPPRALSDNSSHHPVRRAPSGPEPALDASQIQELENKLSAGLLEEVILVAEGELRLVNKILEWRVWEEPEERAPKGQWDYFARDQHQPGTQEPPVEKKS